MPWCFSVSVLSTLVSCNHIWYLVMSDFHVYTSSAMKLNEQQTNHCDFCLTFVCRERAAADEGFECSWEGLP
jgi:hypothetical protein